jgi:hypothetical protein
MWSTVTGDARIQEVDITPLDGTSATATFVKAVAAKWTGFSGGAGVPAVCGLIKLQTGLRGPRHRGRIFLPFTGEGATDNGTIITATQAGATNAWVTFANDMDTAGASLGVASYAHSDWNQAIAIQCETFVATQKRRQDRLRA